MKVAVVSDDQKTIAAHFGRAQGFIIYTVENNNVTSRDWMPNTFTAHMHGQSHGEHVHGHGPVLNALSACDTVISGGMGRRAYVDLTDSGRQVFITSEVDAEKAVNLLLSGQLTDSPEMTCCHGHEHHHDHGHDHGHDHDHGHGCGGH
jgi:predicted Fe-Mo cluster-binding NifX family protein